MEALNKIIDNIDDLTSEIKKELNEDYQEEYLLDLNETLKELFDIQLKLRKLKRKYN
jgi:hypothetical protein